MNPRRRRLAKARRAAAKLRKAEMVKLAPTLTSFARMDRLMGDDFRKIEFIEFKGKRVTFPK